MHEKKVDYYSSVNSTLFDFFSATITQIKLELK